MVLKNHVLMWYEKNKNIVKLQSFINVTTHTKLKKTKKRPYEIALAKARAKFEPTQDHNFVFNINNNIFLNFLIKNGNKFRMEVKVQIQKSLVKKKKKNYFILNYIYKSISLLPYLGLKILKIRKRRQTLIIRKIIKLRQNVKKGYLLKFFKNYSYSYSGYYRHILFQFLYSSFDTIDLIKQKYYAELLKLKTPDDEFEDEIFYRNFKFICMFKQEIDKDVPIYKKYKLFPDHYLYRPLDFEQILLNINISKKLHNRYKIFSY